MYKKRLFLKKVSRDRGVFQNAETSLLKVWEEQRMNNRWKEGARERRKTHSHAEEWGKEKGGYVA